MKILSAQTTKAILLTAIGTGIAILSAGCMSAQDAGTASQQVQDAPAVYANSINRAKAVSNQVERRQNEGLASPGSSAAGTAADETK